jgi:glycosyltransferase involved in cell wall biosynthesis
VVEQRGVNDSAAQRDQALALVMWGDLFEDFFDTIDVSLEQFGNEFTGSWFVGYINALASAGVRTSLIHVSARVGETRRFIHQPTGAEVSILPAPRRHRWLRALYRRSNFRKSLSSIASYNSIPLLKFMRELRRCGAEAVLTQEYEHARFDILVMVGKLARLPVFATFQGGDKPHSRLERFVRPFTVRACAGLIIASSVERQRVRQAYGIPDHRISDVPNAIDIESFTPIARESARTTLGLSETDRIVGWSGRVVIRRKGLDVLIAAWTKICMKRPDGGVLLLLVGSGEDAAELHRMIDATGLRSIHWRDEFLTQKEELLPYQCASDIYVLPSRHEGFPVAPIEAMALGLPVVAADAPGVIDILPDGDESGGIVVPREDVEAMVSALERLIDDPSLCLQLGARARQRAEEHYSLGVVGAQLRKFIVEGPSRPPAGPFGR